MTFVESDPEAGRTRVRLESGQELVIPYLPATGEPSHSRFASVRTIFWSARRPEGISAGNVIPGTVRRIELLDGQAILTVLAGEEFYVRLTAAAVSKLGLVEDSRVFLIMKDQVFPFALTIRAMPEKEFVELDDRLVRLSAGFKPVGGV